MKLGEVLEGRYELRELLGEGGMGQVFLAWDGVLEERVAIKSVRPQAASSLRAIEQLKAEVRKAKALRHPNICDVTHFEHRGTTPFVVMEYVDGSTLDDYLYQLPNHRCDEEEFQRLAGQILDAVEHAHAQGVVHRDLSSNNIMVTPEGSIRVMDFGIAAQMRETVSRTTGAPISLSVHYASPEQINGAPPGPTMDIYSLGCVFHEMLTGEPPFTQGDVLHQQLRREPESLEGVAPDLSAAVLACLRKDPSERPQTIGELRGALAGDGAVRPQEPPTLKADQPSPEQPRSTGSGSSLARWLFGAGAMLMLSLVGMWLWEVGAGGESARETIPRTGSPAVEESTQPEPEPADPEAIATARRNAEREREAERRRIQVVAELEELLAAGDWEGARSRLAAAAEVLEPAAVAEWRGRIDAGRREAEREAEAAAERERIEAELGDLRVGVARSMGAEEWDAAQDQVREWLQLGGDEVMADEWMERIGEGQRRTARITELRESIPRLLDQGQWRQAETRLGQLRSLAPSTPGLSEWSSEIEEGRSREARVRELSEAIPAALEEVNAAEAARLIEELERLEPSAPKLRGYRDRLRDLLRRSRVTFVPIPAGSFEMGCTRGDDECLDGELPRHRVRVSGFQMAETETTNLQYQVCVNAGVCDSVDSEGGAEHPVVKVTWDEAVTFCEWVGGRLPSEAEWEYAARGGRNDSRYPWGNRISHDNANYGKDDCCEGLARGPDRWERTAPVKSFEPNGYGLYDVAGNVWEWVQDRWHDDYGGAPSDGRAWESGGSSLRVLRGGSWSGSRGILRVSHRLRRRASGQGAGAGFRCSRNDSGALVLGASDRDPDGRTGPDESRLAGLDDSEREQVRQLMVGLAGATVASLESLRSELAQLEKDAPLIPEDRRDMFDLMLLLIRERVQELERARH